MEQHDPDSREGVAAAIDRVQAYRLALEGNERAWQDAKSTSGEPLLTAIGPQLVRAVGSIAANVSEGYARRSARDRVRFYEYALGSAEEARSWYEVVRPAIARTELADRLARLVSIRRLLLVMIRNERRKSASSSPRRPPP